MKYSETKEVSGEILRLVIPEMAKHEAAYHPIHYTLWYEAIADLNPSLKRAIDALLAQGLSLDEEQVEALFQRHILERDDDLNKHLRSELRRLIDEMAGLAKESNFHTNRYGNSLVHYEDRLKSQKDPDILTTLVQSLLVETQNTRRSISVLQKQLEERRREIDALRTSLNRAQGEALTDPMTGLLNRRGFHQAMQEALGSAEAGDPTCLLMLDIDHFKKVNDAYGHLIGDKVIRTLGEVLSASVKGQDSVARFGGEEFAVLLPRTPVAGASALAETIRSAVAKVRIRRTNGPELAAVTVSLGVAAFRAGESGDDFIHRADMALYASKRHGRNRVTLYSEDIAA